VPIILKGTNPILRRVRVALRKIVIRLADHLVRTPPQPKKLPLGGGEGRREAVGRGEEGKLQNPGVEERFGRKGGGIRKQKR